MGKRNLMEIYICEILSVQTLRNDSEVSKRNVKEICKKEKERQEISGILSSS